MYGVSCESFIMYIHMCWGTFVGVNIQGCVRVGGVLKLMLNVFLNCSPFYLF